MIYISHLLEDKDMAELLNEGQYGIESIEFSISENLDHLDEKLLLYEKRLRDMHCKDLTIHGPFLDINPMAFDSLVLEITRKRYEQAYAAAKALGAKKIVYHTCFIPRVYLLIGWADRVIDFYKRFMDGKEGITVCMENVQDPEIEPILQVAEGVDHPDFGICLDAGHAHCYSKHPVMEWADLLGAHIRHLHVHDNDGSYDMHNALGTGTIPYPELLSLVEKNNPQVTYTIECSDREKVEKSLSFIKKMRFQID